MAVWQKGPAPAPPRRSRFWARRAASRLELPASGPAVLVWHLFDEVQQQELEVAAADACTSDHPARAVVIAALQRQLERQRERRLVAQSTLALGVSAVALAFVPEIEVGVSTGLFVAGMSYLQEVALTRARRANEQLARAHGYPLPPAREEAAWGFDRPVPGDPLFAISLMLAAVVWLAVWRDAHLVVRVLLVPALVASIGVVLGTLRGFVRGLRDR